MHWRKSRLLDKSTREKSVRRAECDVHYREEEDEEEEEDS